jgi:hypothetical protein
MKFVHSTTLICVEHLVNDESYKRIYLSLVVAPGLGLLRPLLPLSVDRPLSLLSRDSAQSASAS